MGHGTRWLRPLLAAAVVVSGLAVSGAAHAETVTKKVFSDGFGGNQYAGVDPAKWSGGSWGAWQDGDGHLVLSSSLSTVTNFSQSSGHVSARMRAGDSPPAWKLLGVQTKDGGSVSGRSETLGIGTTSVGNFHTYAIDWTMTAFVWSVDGLQVLRLTPDTAGQPFKLSLNPGGGGGYSSDQLLVDAVAVTVKYTVAPAPAWKAFTTYKVGARVSYKGATYRVREAHTALPGWEPSVLPNLFAKV
jgi:hypothetical protein